ncbi:MAG TPA: hypothetical protein PKE69_24775, partial [Pyrinomonadaceae bacterium]|nr:hypothetical protein [Pyrinomonadaceae bacterium]
FQRVKAYLLRTSNAKALSTSDEETIENQRPTLKRRQPTDTTTDTGDSSSTDNKPTEKPTLKRNETQPSPSPEK